MSQDFKVPPILGPDTAYETWRNEIQVWEMVTDMKPEKHALAVALTLTGQARAKALEIGAEELNSKDGMNILLKVLDGIFLPDGVDLAYCVYADFDKFKKAENMSMNDFIKEYERRYSVCRKYLMEYPEAVLAFKLLDNAGLSEKERQLVLAAAPDRQFSSMKLALKMTFGDHPETKEASETNVGQQVVDRLKTDPTRVEGNTLRVLLVGRTGGGKSSTGNTLLGQELFHSEVSFSSVTHSCQVHSAQRWGTTIEVTDCPGLFDTNTPDEDVATTILESLTAMNPGPDVIAYVIELGSYTVEEFNAYGRVKALMESVTDHMLVIFTHGDRLRGRDVWDKLKEAPQHLQTVLKECGHRVLVFDNTLPYSDSAQVKALLREGRKLAEENQHRPYVLHLDDDPDTETGRRLMQAEKTEMGRKDFVQKLIRKRADAERSLSAERSNWTRRETELKESQRRMEDAMEKKRKNLSDSLNNQRDVNRGLTVQIGSLQGQLGKYR